MSETWRVFKRPQGFIVGSADRDIATVNDLRNAFRIAALPDVLEASARALFHMTVRGWSTTEGHELKEVYEQLKSAVAKAGERGQ